MKRYVPILVFFLTSCLTTAHENYQSYLQQKGAAESTKTQMKHCHGYGCKFVSTVELTKKDWKQLRAPFTPAPATPEAERAAIAKAVGLMERIAGPKDGTEGDLRGTFVSLGDHQLDCVDESTNTTTTLGLLQDQKLLRFHTMAPPELRVPLVDSGRWPHQTAVIVEIATQEHYAVDSWFRDNGADADIVELRQWKDGWHPDKG